ncbi:periplasmic heavy metal sensor [Microbulbifer sp. S227A]|uniref:periplasmic heavy metal sensor n=1 Tax=Microbulbifer sp. S227A TaxID=3415131 RepID=UPI003C7B1856
MNMQQDTPAPRNRLWLRLLLGASLALNLLVIGLAVGAAMRFGGPEGARRPPPVLGATLYRELPREDRRAVREAMRHRSADPGPDRKTATLEVAALVRETPFDPVALETLFAEQFARRETWQAMANTVLLEQLGRMSDGARQAYADRLEDAANRSRDRGKKHKDK